MRVNERSFRLKTWARISRASHGQPKKAKIIANNTIVIWPRSKKLSRISTGNTGMTTKLSLMDMSTLSIVPPRYPAVSPTKIATTRDTAAVNKPSSSELRNANPIHQNMSWPRELVPKGCCKDGGMSAGTLKVFDGLYGETRVKATRSSTASRKTKATRKRMSCFRRSRTIFSMAGPPTGDVPADQTAGK